MTKGTGLGLSTALTIVKSHGGFINVYSELHKGSQFTLYLPAVDTPGAARCLLHCKRICRSDTES